ncbi:MAG: asparagine synthase (glutamine-hydrolyzing) [Thiolinea sp.]
MCGINGLIHYPSVEKLEAAIRNMGHALHHRGPDATGIWLDHEKSIALGHQRLAIVDLSPAGQQPMQCGGGRFVMVFNGEIYNHRQLRSELKQSGFEQWRGHSDSETLLAGFTFWGITATLNRCTGMFAIALWDRQQQTLHLIRDRVGEKPLYYGYFGSCFAFTSELKAFRTLDIFNKPVDRNALEAYLHYGYIPAPHSIYTGISKLKPGTILTLHYSPEPHQQATNIQQWWSFNNTVQQARQNPITDEAEARARLQQQLQTSIQQQSSADVAVGAFLSGGIDSTTIVNQLCKTSSQQIKTFCVGFEQPGYNEAEQAAGIARFLGTEHEEIYVSGREARDVIPLLPAMYDEPFADTSQIPTYLIARHARQYVTVALSGDAGDELFGGYSSYLHSPAIWNTIRNLPLKLRNLLARFLITIKPQHWNWIATKLHSAKLNGNNLHKLGNSLHDCNTLADFFTHLDLQFPASTSLVIGSDQFQTTRLPEQQWQAFAQHDENEHAMMLTDSLNGLPDDILCKVDRAAMAVSLETRIPFLDHQLIELAWRLPLEMKIQRGRGKNILRQLLYQDIPEILIERPKQGFTVPIADWLRHDLRDWAEDLLAEENLRNEAYLDSKAVRRHWQQFLSGKRANQQLIWNILMFQAWREYWES